MSPTPSPRSPWLVASLVLLASLLAAAIACADTIPDFFERLRIALNGGTGESADWGQPLFYMAFIGAAPGLITGAVTFGVIAAIRRLRNPKPPASLPSA